MCFNKELTLVFSILGVFIGGWIISGKGIWNIPKWRRVRVSSCMFWFSFMEFLQFIQYLVIDDCENMVNILWTALGWIHICFQPVFSNLALSALDKRNMNRERMETWSYVINFSIVTGVLMALRMIIPAVYEKQPFPICDSKIEGVCGPRTCSTTGIYHIQWEFLMLRPMYPFPNVAAHFLNMFVAPILMGQPFASILLFLTGPFIAALFPAKAGEKSSIWCFFSIAESTITILSQYLACRSVQKKNMNDENNKNNKEKAN